MFLKVTTILSYDATEYSRAKVVPNPEIKPQVSLNFISNINENCFKEILTKPTFSHNSSLKTNLMVMVTGERVSEASLILLLSVFTAKSKVLIYKMQ